VSTWLAPNSGRSIGELAPRGWAATDRPAKAFVILTIVAGNAVVSSAFLPSDITDYE